MSPTKTRLLVALTVAVVFTAVLAQPAAARITFEPGDTQPSFGGSDEPAPFIVGGVDASDGEWPFMAALVFSWVSSPNDGQFCGGAIIDPFWVATAAHCVTSFPSNSVMSASDLDVVLGVTDLTEAGQRVRAADIIVHPDWSYQEGQHDIALIKLSEKTLYRPVSLAETIDADLFDIGTIAMNIGWGNTESVSNPVDGNYPSVLQEVGLRITSDSECAGAIGGGATPFVGSTMVCGVSLVSDNTGPCFGDSGGPFVVRDAAGWLLLGITSFGTTPCGDALPDAYTELPAYEAWLDSWLPPVDRTAGPDRFSTAAAVSAESFASGVDAVYIATGLDYPDALAAGVAAGATDSPLLLTLPGLLPGATKNELTRLAPAEIIVVGGSGVVSDAVVTELEAFTTGSVTRLSGADRFSTAAAVSSATFAPGVDKVFVATGLDFPDALSAGSAAGTAGVPLLLTLPSALPGTTWAEITRLEPNEIVVVGGTGVVSDEVFAELDALAPVRGATRLSGTDRYSTAAAVSATFPAGVSKVYIATGLDFPDALAAGAAAGAFDAPLLLTSRTKLPNATRNELVRLGASEIIVVGGQAVIDDSVARHTTAYLP